MTEVGPATWDIYVNFVEERHRIWERRRDRAPRPWTEDPILGRAKFTNMFRVLDAGSQFLLRELLLPAESYEETVFRAFLYRYANRPEPWVWFKDVVGDYPTVTDLLDGTLESVWVARKRLGHPIFGIAYRINSKGSDRLSMVLGITTQLVREEYPSRLLELDGRPAEQWAALQEIRWCGEFLSMQILTDLGYTGRLPSWDEDLFVAPGPGCILGAGKLGLDATGAIRKSWSHFQKSGTVLLDGLPPSLMDIQNTFCEFGKYDRFRTGGAPRGYHPLGTDHSDYVLPVRWGGV